MPMHGVALRGRELEAYERGQESMKAERDVAIVIGDRHEKARHALREAMHRALRALHAGRPRTPFGMIAATYLHEALEKDRETP